jgi:hypothetical protein
MEEEGMLGRNETTSYIIVRVDARDGDWDWLKISSRGSETPTDHVADLKMAEGGDWLKEGHSLRVRLLI